MLRFHRCHSISVQIFINFVHIYRHIGKCNVLKTPIKSHINFFNLILRVKSNGSLVKNNCIDLYSTHHRNCQKSIFFVKSGLRIENLKEELFLRGILPFYYIQFEDYFKL